MPLLIPAILWGSLAWSGVSLVSKKVNASSLLDPWRKPDDTNANTVRNIAVAASVISAGVALYTIARK